MKLKHFPLLGCVLIGVLMASATIESASAHSGRTNSSGCHNNRLTGDYHCHNSGSSDGAADSSSSYERLPSSSSSSLPRDLFSPGNILEPESPTTNNSATTTGRNIWKVVSVGDGDTIRVQQGEDTKTIRLACIDSPELAQTPYGDRSKRYLQSMLPIDTAVTLRQVDIDRYDRVVAEVFKESNNINLSLVKAGHAVAYRQYLSNCDREAYLEAEATAQQNRSAFWSQAYPIMPWEFRRQQE